VPQTFLDGASRPMPQGKVLGGGSILNAMCWNRGGQDDYNSWEALGNPGWGWEGLLPYFMRVGDCQLLDETKLTLFQSETYTPPPADVEMEYFIQPSFAVHGTDGPVQVSYPKFFYSQSRKHSRTET
jgi:choline dehydrogenase